MRAEFVELLDVPAPCLAEAPPQGRLAVQRLEGAGERLGILGLGQQAVADDLGRGRGARGDDRPARRR